MKVYESKDIRNVGVVGHGDSGKTTLTAGLLFTAGATNRLLSVDEGNTVTDFDDEEISAQDHHLHGHRRGRVEEGQDQPSRHSRLQHLH